MKSARFWLVACTLWSRPGSLGYCNRI